MGHVELFQLRAQSGYRETRHGAQVAAGSTGSQLDLWFSTAWTAYATLFADAVVVLVRECFGLFRQPGLGRVQSCEAI